jgi:hypothetical protein
MWEFPDWWRNGAASLLVNLSSSDTNFWLLFRFLLDGLLRSAPLWLADFCLGLALLLPLRHRLPAFPRAAAALGIGMLCNGMLLFALGLLGRYRMSTLLWVHLLELGILPPLLWRWRAWPRLHRGWAMSRWWLLLLLPLLFVVMLDLLMPVLEYDSGMYHMSTARWYRDTQGLNFNPALRFSNLPHLSILLYLRQWMWCGDEQYVKLANLEYLLLLFFTFNAAARYLRLQQGLATAIALLFLSPLLQWTLRTEYADFPLLAFHGTACLLLWLSLRPRAALALPLLGGCLLGAVASTKMQGLVLAAITGFAYLVASCWPPLALRSSLQRSVVCGLAALAPALPWWLRSIHHTGFPFYPFAAGPNEEARLHYLVNSVYGMGQGIPEFLRLPWRMVSGPPEKYTDPFVFGPVIALLLPAVCLLLWQRRLHARLALFGGITLLGFLVFWFQSGQVFRYLTALLPFSTVLLLSALPRRSSWLAWLGVLPLIAATALSTQMVRYGTTTPVRFSARDNLLATNAAWPALRRLPSARHRTWLWFCEELKFRVPGYVAGDWFGQYNYHWLHEGQRRQSPEAFRDRLREAGFRYVLLDRRRGLNGGTIYERGFFDSGWMRNDLNIAGVRRLYSDHQYALFEILP